MRMAKGEKTKRHVLIALLWVSAILNLLLIALLTREQPAEPIKGTYCTEGSTAEKTYLVIDSHGNYAVYRQGAPVLEAGTCAQKSGELYTLTPAEGVPRDGVYTQSAVYLPSLENGELLTFNKLGDTPAFLGVEPPQNFPGGN